MKTVYLLKGLPASGKSTWAKKLIDDNPNSYKRINKDDLRAMLDNSHWSKGNEKFVVSIRDELIREALLQGYHIIVDDTNLHPKHETNIKALVQKFSKVTGYQVKVEVKEFLDVDVEECIKRDMNRPVSVGEKVIRNMYNQFLAPEIKMIEQDDSLPRAIICDLDGTLALMDGRSPFDWKECINDKVNEPVRRVIESMKETHAIIMLSGRDGCCQPETKQWFINNDIPHDELFMREKDDSRKDSIIKKELFDESIRDKYYVEFVLDDRDQVVNLWRREIGIPCFQVNYGDF